MGNYAQAAAPRTNHSLTSLKRWSCEETRLPPVEQIKTIHVYDFDSVRASGKRVV